MMICKILLLKRYMFTIDSLFDNGLLITILASYKAFMFLERLKWHHAYWSTNTLQLPSYGSHTLTCQVKRDTPYF